MRRLVPAAFVCLVLLGTAAEAQRIVPSRGTDARVDYAELVRFGPWDDRNYRLTAEDLALLSPEEAELADPIPAFFRVEMRRAWPALRRHGKGQYPRSALQIFRGLYGGYLVDGRLYTKVERRDGRFRVILSGGVEREAFEASKALAGEVRVTSPDGAAESAVKIHPTDPSRVIAGSNGPGFGQDMHYSTDGGETWQPAAALAGNTCCDPTVDWKSDGSLAYAAALGDCGFGGCGVWVYRSSDGGQTWDDFESLTPGSPRRVVAVTNADKEYLHVDQHPTSPYRDNVYLTWHEGNVMQFGRSTDDGHLWSTIAFGADPAGIGSDITTDRNGAIYYVWPAFFSRAIVLKKSTDGGASFAPGVATIAPTEAAFEFPLPAMDTRNVFVYASADADRSDGPFADSVYVAWTDSTAATGFNPLANHGRIQVARSRDGGATWNVTTPHETADLETVDRFHPWLAVGPDGTVHVVFYDTRRDPSRTSVDLFYSFSQDGGVTFSTPERLTSVASPKISDGFEFGDYNGLDAVMSQVIAVYTDNRDEASVGGDSVDVYAAGRALDGIFADGFESGDTASWTRAVP